MSPSRLPQNQNKDLLTRNDSSWLGGGSEFLIASAFEVGPPVIIARPNQGGSTSESEMPPKAATIGPLVEDEDDGREAAATTTTTFGAAPIPKAVKKGKDKKKNKSNDSPLAKLFGRPAFSASPEETITILKDRGTNKGKQVKMVEQTVSEKEGDVEQLKKEIELMRQSQLRMEEMLAGFLAGKSA